MALDGRTEDELSQSLSNAASENITNDDVEMESHAQEEQEPLTGQVVDNNSGQPEETPRMPISVQLVTAVQESPDIFQPKASSKLAKRMKHLKSPTKSPEKDDDSHCCPICFEPWSNSGSHRLASLSCGHLFGRSCIERWLKAKGGNDKCPQCNAPAKKKDIRNIYARAIKTIDTTERDRALADLEKEKEARNRAEQAEARVLLQYQLAKADCDRMKLQLQEQQELLLNYQTRNSGCSKCGSLVEVNTSRTYRESTSSQGSSTCNKCYVLQKSFQVSQSGARVMAFDRHHALLVISKPSPNQLFPGFGVLKVSSLDSKHCEFVRIHQKAVRDAAFNLQGDGLLLTAGMDKTLRMTSTISNTVVQTYATPVPAWSCAWNNSDTNYVYCGLQNGACLIFDVRNTTTYLTSLQNEAAVSCPVVSLAHVLPNPQSLLKPGGILVCKLEGACYWENTFGADYLPHSLTLPEGSCTSLSFEPVTRHCMFSLRPSKSFQKSRHVVCQLQGNGIGASTSRGLVENTGENNQNTDNTTQGGGLCTSNAIAQCVGGSTKKLLSKSTLFTCPGNANKLLAAAGDESAKATLVWDATNGKQLQKLPNQGSAILDVMKFDANGSEFLTTIDEQKLTIYKWQ